MSRWPCFRQDAESIPETPYEACVFLDNAVHHLWNRRTEHEIDDAFWILNQAHRTVNEGWQSEEKKIR